MESVTWALGVRMMKRGSKETVNREFRIDPNFSQEWPAAKRSRGNGDNREKNMKENRNV
jgi:hypothetical protein